VGAVVGAGKRIEFIRGYLTTVFADDLHAKRVDSLANGTLGVMAGASLAVSIIGQALAQARGLLTKHAIKQVDRLLSNQGIVVWDMFSPWWRRWSGGARRSSWPWTGRTSTPTVRPRWP